MRTRSRSSSVSARAVRSRQKKMTESRIEITMLENAMIPTMRGLFSQLKNIPSAAIAATSPKPSSTPAVLTNT